MAADKLLFTWKDYTIHGDPQGLYTLTYQGKVLSQRLVTGYSPSLTPGELGDLIIQLTDQAVGQVDLVEALAADLLSDPDVLDWWICQGCGRRTFLVPCDEPVCVWCGLEEAA